jgi:hypothetical protein
MHTWFLDADLQRIRVRFRIASGPEIVHDVPLAGAKLRALTASGDDWALGPLVVPDTLGQTEFVLRGAPEHVTQALRRATS